MKNLWSKIATLIIPLVLSSEIKAQDSINPKNFFKAGIGNYIWNENSFENLFQFNLGNETYLTKSTNLEFGFDYGNKKNKIKEKEYELIKFSLKFGLNRYFLISDNKKTALYGSGGIKYISILENPTEIKEDNTIGFYYGAGIESLLNSNAKMFLDIRLNDAKTKGYNKKINLSGITLECGIKINLQEENNKKSKPYSGDRYDSWQ